MCQPTVEVKEVSVSGKQSLTREQVKKLSDPDKLLLIIVHDKVYNVTNWQDNHPGGSLTIRALSGRDATDSFRQNHPKLTYKILPKFLYATLSDPDNGIDEATLAFRELTDKMEDAGMFQTNYSYYYFLWARLAIHFGCVLYLCLCKESVYAHALAGALLGMFWQQIAFVGHDLGHNGITHNITKDSRLALFFANFSTGIGMGWWKRSHNVHHIVTNSVDYDPDIQHLPVFAVSPTFLEKPMVSKFYNMLMPLNKVTHLLVGVQHWLYYPVMAFARFNLYAQTILHLFGLGPYSLKEKIYRRDLQILFLGGFWCWFTALVMSLPTFASRALFVLMSHNVAGMLHVQITLSHFPMDTYEGVTYDNSENGFLFTQLNGSMDIDCPRWMDWFHGGLHLQVVHHLWPRIPRHNLRKVQQILKDFVKQYPHLQYHEHGFVKANKIMLSKLKETSKKAKSFHELFGDSINLAG